MDDNALYHAFLARDAAHDGTVWAGVTSTGIYCRFTCPARKPLRKNTRFFNSPEAARAAGLRACKLCDPDGA